MWENHYRLPSKAMLKKNKTDSVRNKKLTLPVHILQKLGEINNSKCV